MNERNINVNADFLSIALEEIEGQSYESAKEFIDDVRVNMRNAGWEDEAADLQYAINHIDAGKPEGAQEYVSNVYDTLLEEL